MHTAPLALEKGAAVRPAGPDVGAAAPGDRDGAKRGEVRGL